MIVEAKHKGVVLSGVFDPSSPNFKKELAAFQVKLAELQKRLGFEEFLHAVTHKGKKVRIDIIPTQTTAPAAKTSTKKGDAADASSFARRSGGADWMKQLSKRVG